jgi:NAD(P)-dependent dehydrogenase (short-subunit alcohol dehydrogenase family)
MNPFRLDGKVAVITGAGGLIGSATARLFAAQGARLLLTDLDSNSVDALAVEIGSSAVSWSTDLAQVSSCQTLIEKTIDTFGQLNILVNNVGVCPRVPFLESSELDWERIVSINQKSMFFCSQASAPHLAKTLGCIVSTASFAGRAGAVANASIYSGTKGAIIALTKALARELAPDVRVNAVAPGAIDTPMVRALPPERLAALIETIPLKRLGTAQEVAAAMLFLAADTCCYMTGATIDINGGWMML